MKTTREDFSNALTSDDRRQLGNLCTRDDSGKHFTTTTPGAWLERMEALGYITIDRPVHSPTGIPYSQDHWSVEVASEVAEWFDALGELIA